MTYQGKNVVVTGAASGMGRAAAQLLVERGANVVALDVNAVDVDGVRSLPIDLRDEASIVQSIDAIDGRIDSLFNCAGLPHTFPAEDIMEVAFFGLRALTERVAERMPSGATIVNISSTAGLGWQANLPIITALLAMAPAEARDWCRAHPDVVGDGYPFAKQCVIVYTMSRGVDFVARGIRMNSTSPGDTETGMSAAFRQHFGDEFIDSIPRPIGRAATPAEQAEVLLFLNSEAASYISGANVVVDAGAYGGILTGRLVPPARPQVAR